MIISDKALSEQKLPEEALTASVVIPLYRSKTHFASLATLLEQLFHRLSSESELIFINDGDPDLVHPSVYERFQTLNISLVVLQLKQNHGQMTASLCGMSVARCPIVLTLDADTACGVELLEQLVRRAQATKHLAYMDKKHVGQRPVSRNLITWINQKVFRLLVGNRIEHHSGSSIRAIELSLVQQLLQKGRCSELMDVWLLNSAHHVSFVPYVENVPYRTSYSYTSLFKFILRSAKCIFNKKVALNPAQYIYRTEKFTD